MSDEDDISDLNDSAIVDDIDTNNYNESDNDIEDNIDNSEEILNNTSDIFLNTDENIIENNNRITKPFLTKYEKVRILGLRTKQLSLGAKPLIKLNDFLEPDKIAELEYKNKLIPFKIKRPLPNGTYEIWKFNELNQI